MMPHEPPECQPTALRKPRTVGELLALAFDTKALSRMAMALPLDPGPTASPAPRRTPGVSGNPIDRLTPAEFERVMGYAAGIALKNTTPDEVTSVLIESVDAAAGVADALGCCIESVTESLNNGELTTHDVQILAGGRRP